MFSQYIYYESLTQCFQISFNFFSQTRINCNHFRSEHVTLTVVDCDFVINSVYHS